MPEKTPGKIVTFYSYKGGTGRSMTLANVAWILAAGGKKVLAIDWDLEAPGLHRYFYPFLIDKELTASDGVIDFVNNFALEAVSPQAAGGPDRAWFVSQANILRYAVALNHEFPRQGRIDFVPAGRQGVSYPARVNSFDWQKFYDRLGGGVFLEEVKRQVRAEYDYVLIDSRTGVSDTSGICTIQMPDVLVPCFTLNHQGMDGALRVTQSVFAQRKESGLEVFPVPMRLDTGENQKLERRSKEAEDKFYPFPNHLKDGDWRGYWDDVRVYYVPYFSYEEVLAVYAQERRSGSLLREAETLTRYLTHGEVERLDPEAVPSEAERERVQAIYAGQPVKFDLEAELDRVADNAFARLSPDERLRARRLVLRLVRLSPGTEEDGATRQRQQPLDNFPLADLRIIHDLRNSRLLFIGADSATGKQTVQLAQEEYLRGWRQLRVWMEEDREFLLWLAGLRDAHENWQRAKAEAGKAQSGSPINPDDLLLEGARLAEARDWLKRRYSDIYPAERDFIEKSRQKHDPGRDAPSVRVAPHAAPNIPSRDSENLEKALAILRGQQATPTEMLQLAKLLKAETRFGYARRLLARASKHESVARDKKLHEVIFQQLALCTYKDQDLPADERLDTALAILNVVADFATTTNQETLGLLGSIFKRKWEVDGQRANLERSLHYYLRGYGQGPAGDQGYTGINAAFVLDQLASLEDGEADKASGSSGAALQRRERARAIRQDIIEQVGPLISDPDHRWVTDMWWYYATLAEAHFGLQRYDDAVQWLADGQEAAGEIYEWELESCARQLAAIARLQDDEHLTGEDFAYTPAWAALEKAFGANTVARSAFVGKIGLALSGGGFRASLYHLGVLARLAELDVLRQVEVLSCVSGGSIVGAHYYLMVRNLLQNKPEEEITREDYVNLVRELIGQFLRGVQQNIRVRVALNPLRSLRMLWTKGYSRTVRAGELYEEVLFSRVEDGEQHEERWLDGLTIAPLTRQADGTKTRVVDFAPKYQNWRRDAKVPILVLNAATLNTGHTWQFTAHWMGESPAGIDSEIDGNDRLRRMYYADAPKGYRRVRLGQAVAASSAVPGVFEPITFDELYPDRVVRLTDGGVCDNQGISSLQEQDCKVMLVSDASGQMSTQRATSGGIFGVLLRTYDVFQARIREAEYRDLKGRRRSGLLRGLMFVHLKGDLEGDPVDWVNCPDPYVASDDARPASRRGPLTRYGIAKDIQTLLSGLRTDLDSFSDAEAYALMTSGYRMTEYQFKYEKCVEGFAAPRRAEDWEFLQIEDGMRGVGERYEYLRKLLTAGNRVAFKVWQIDPALNNALKAALLLVAILSAAVLVREWDSPLPSVALQQGANVLKWAAQKMTDVVAMPGLTVGQLVFAVGALFFTLLLVWVLAIAMTRFTARNVAKAARWKDAARRLALAPLLSTVGCVLAFVHIYVFDKRFLRLGSLDALKKK